MDLTSPCDSNKTSKHKIKHDYRNSASKVTSMAHMTQVALGIASAAFLEKKKVLGKNALKI